MNKLVVCTRSSWLAVLLYWAGTSLAVPVLAKGADEEGYAARVVRCESRDLQWVHCPMDISQGVELVRQLSGESCVRGSQWGTDRSGVWVTLGCRAEFHARATAAQAGEGRKVRRVLRCESKGRPQSCPVRLGGAPVRLLRQLSFMPCREGHSWGYRRNEVWTTRGCQGDFEVGSEEDGSFVEVPRRISCDSKDHRRRFCGASIGTGAQLLEQRSSSTCEEGRSWGWDRFGVWVDDGCRGDFLVN